MINGIDDAQNDDWETTEIRPYDQEYEECMMPPFSLIILILIFGQHQSTRAAAAEGGTTGRNKNSVY